MSNDSNNKKESWFSWLLWWKTDEQEIEKQVEQYDKLGILKSKKGISSLLLLLSAVLILALIIFFGMSAGALLYVGLFLFLGFFIYKGHLWAMIGTMIWSTFSLCTNFYNFIVTNFENGTGNQINPLMWGLFFWAISMHVTFYAFRIEQARVKQRKEAKAL